MPFSDFGRPKADLNIRVSGNTLRPGDAVEARVELMPREDFHVRLGRVELVRVETCVQITRSQYGTHYSKKTHAVSLAEGTLMENQTVRRMGGHRRDVRFRLPTDALPTMNGAVVQKIEPGIGWEVRASLDVSRARDLSESQAFVVDRIPAFDDSPPQPVVEETAHRQCALTLNLSRGEARSGDRIGGSLRAEMIEDVDVDGVRVELVRKEKFGNEAQDHVVDRADLERDETLESGEAREWSFSLDVGQVSIPSLETEKSSVTWLVKGILDRNLRRDLRVEREITVGF
ncbi:MAG: hypothetical protein F4Y49_13420 [Dehalococcoidia bacterium]|nr:hypothetical protein [Dehalococcoidia bacterium]